MALSTMCCCQSSSSPSLGFLLLGIDRLRHQLVPVYTYDPLEEEEEEEEEEETERDVLLRSENAEAIQGLTGFYQHEHPLLVKNGSA
ncbi:small integral membrane protein 29-like isoform X2 [Anguilla rostrata]|uniref:small integral membrane protein 29-like isoform X2 n=1 Tax=Anguilla rostrata TaxID=7938 RepID=UPI0030D34672